MTLVAAIGVGGAEFHAVLKASDGRTPSEVNHRDTVIRWQILSGRRATWTTAERAINQFAEKVADAYEAQTHAQ